MTKHPRPAWLIGLVAGASALMTIGGCARISGELIQTGHLRTISDESSPVAAGMQLTSTAPSTAFVQDSLVLPRVDRPVGIKSVCPPDMASVDDRFCVDKYEASLVEILPSGEERAWPYFRPVEGHVVRAVSQRGVYPQGYINEKQAKEACGRSNKRLCKPGEWRTACQGPDKKKWGYGNEYAARACNDHGKSPMAFYYGRDMQRGTAFVFDKMNDPQLNQLAGTLAETGSHESCVNGYGLHDMVGNIHEWVDDDAGTFQGGYYLDVTINGDGCMYRSDAHAAWYHDYSTGFRCCADTEL